MPPIITITIIICNLRLANDKKLVYPCLSNFCINVNCSRQNVKLHSLAQTRDPGEMMEEEELAPGGGRAR